MANHSQKWHNETSTRCRSTENSDGLAAIQAQLNNLGREIKKKKEKHLKKHITLNLPQGGQYRAAARILPKVREIGSTKLIVELADRPMKHPKGIPENVIVRIDKFVFPIDFIVLDMPEDIKNPLILGRSFLSTAHAKIDVFKRKITLRVGNDKVVFKSDKPTSNIIEKVYALSLREKMELDLEARLMGEALILNKLLDLLYGGYIELN
ncbi:putative reverse transcriptase domain-containing protein [Tanacetum coccineum]